MNNPKISVIIPTYNCAKYLSVAIDSALSQTYQDHEIVIINDGSTDDTETVVKGYIDKYPEKINYIYQENKGFAAARNRGIKEAKGEYVAFLDADDAWMPFKLKLQMDYLTKNPYAVALSTQMCNYNMKKIVSMEPDARYKVEIYTFRDMLIKNYMCDPTMIVRRDALLRIGLLRENLEISADYEMWLKLSRIENLHKIMLVTTFYRERPDGLSSGNRKKTIVKHIRVVKMLFSEKYINDKKHHYLKKHLSLFCYESSVDYTERKKYLEALKYLFLSVIYHPLKFPIELNYKFIRIRRFRRICINIINLQKNKLRVVIVSSSLDHIKRGVEAWSTDTFLALKERSIDVNLYKGSGQKKEKNEHIISTLQAGTSFAKRIMKFIPKWCWHIGAGSDYQLQQTIFSIKLLPKLLYKRNIILHTQEAHTAFLMQKFINWRIINAKLILAHGTEEPFEYLNNFDYVQHLAPYHLDEAMKNGVKNKKAFAIPNFVDTARFRPEINTKIRKELGIPDNAFVVLTVAAIKKTHKRIDYLLKEIATIKDKNNIYLIIAGGKTDETNELVNMGKTLLKERVRFLIDIDREKMPEIYTVADIFTLCSLKEMMPIALLEALSSALPCICNKYPVLEWMVGSGGECIDMAQDGELSSVIEKYFNSDLRNVVKKRARQQAINKFSKGVVVREITDMYKNVLKGQR